MREIEIERPACNFAESRGWFQFKIEKASKGGIPDRFLARQGRIILIEFKAPNKEPKSQQVIRHRELREHGVEVFVVDNLEKAREILY